MRSLYNTNINKKYTQSSELPDSEGYKNNPFDNNQEVEEYNKKAQEEDTWHLQSEVKRSIKQIDLVLSHLDMFRNSHNYFDYPKTKTVPNSELYNGQTTYKIEFIDKECGEEQFKEFMRFEQKHYDKFWKLLKQWHTNWWA